MRVNSTVLGFDWPGLPNPRGCQLLALLYQLEQSEWLSPAEVFEEQARQAYRLVAHAIAHIPYYRQRYGAVGISARDLRGPEDWRRLPLLERADVQDHFKQLQCRPKEHGELSLSTTSGSSGSPVVTVGTAVTRILWHALTLRQHLWTKQDLSKKLAVIRSISKENEQEDEQRFSCWGGATVDVCKTGPLVVLDIHTDIAEQARWLAREDPDYFMTYPSNAAALLEYFQENELKLPNLRELRTFGELLESSLRPLCQRVWGVRVVDGYSSQEVGYIALQCPQAEHYHVQAESVLVEVLDDDGEPCRPGEVGRVVITTLKNYAMPLIRYAIGDYAEVGAVGKEGCPCGRGLPVLQRIVGRQRNMAILPDGRRVWPCISDRLVGRSQDVGLPPVRHFQVIQKLPDFAELKLVAARPLAEAEEAMVRAMIDSAFGWPMTTQITYVDSIPRGAGGKFEEYRCEIPPDILADLSRTTAPAAV